MKFMIVGTMAVACAAGASVAQTGVLYLNDISNQTTWLVQGGGVVGSFNRQGSQTSALAVAGDIRTFGQNSEAGHLYDLNGNYQGVTYGWNGTPTNYDGTTDGVNYNYGVAYSSGQVLRYDRNWQNGQALFNTISGMLGVAYDAGTNTLWTAHVGNNTVYQYSMGGTLQTSFSLSQGLSGFYYSVAFDNLDGTVWVAGYNQNPAPFKQYDRNGNLMQEFSLNLPNYAGGIIGMEFNIPTPGAAALLGLGGLAAARRRR